MIKENSVRRGLAGCESSRNKAGSNSADALCLCHCLSVSRVPSTASMAFRRRGFRRGWGGPFWGPAPLLYTGAAVGAGYAIGRRGGDYYGEDPYPQPGVAPQQRPSQLIVRVHAGSGLRDRCWTTRQDVVAEVYLYIDGSLFSRARVPEVARGGGGDPVWRGGRNAVALPLPPRLDLARASLSVQLLCANVLMQDQLIGTTGQGCAAVADGQPRDTEVGPRGRLTWTVEYQPGLDQAVDARPAARAQPPPQPAVYGAVPMATAKPVPAYAPPPAYEQPPPPPAYQQPPPAYEQPPPPAYEEPLPDNPFVPKS